MGFPRFCPRWIFLGENLCRLRWARINKASGDRDTAVRMKVPFRGQTVAVWLTAIGNLLRLEGKRTACVCVYVWKSARARARVLSGHTHSSRRTLSLFPSTSLSPPALSLSPHTHSGAARWRTTQSWIIVLRAGLSRGFFLFCVYALATDRIWTDDWNQYLCTTVTSAEILGKTDPRRCSPSLSGRVLWIHNQDRLTWVHACVCAGRSVCESGF